MIKGKTVLGIIPARGGSKGIPRKNIKLLCGKPLIAWTIEEAKKSKYIDRLILSTEDNEIIKVAKEWGCEVPFKRPKELAKDKTPGIEPVLHAIKKLPEKYDYVCLLQPTSPLRKAEHIDGAIEQCIDNKADSCVSVTEVEKHPYWMYEIKANNLIVPLIKKELVTRRQDLPKVYVLNGALYVIKANVLKQKKKFINEKTIAYVMDRERSVDIDNIKDFKYCEYFLFKE